MFIYLQIAAGKIHTYEPEEKEQIKNVVVSVIHGGYIK